VTCAAGRGAPSADMTVLEGTVAAGMSPTERRVIFHYQMAILVLKAWKAYQYGYGTPSERGGCVFL
jgi:hypothetical protein